MSDPNVYEKSDDQTEGNTGNDAGASESTDPGPVPGDEPTDK